MKARWKRSTHAHVTRRSPLSGQENTMVIPLTVEQFDRWQKGELLQRVAPDLSSDEREFLINGMTPADSAVLYGTGEE